MPTIQCSNKNPPIMSPLSILFHFEIHHDTEVGYSQNAVSSGLQLVSFRGFGSCMFELWTDPGWLFPPASSDYAELG